MLDPIATGPLTSALGLTGLAATVLLFTFVLLGDFRVLIVLFSAAGRAADLRTAARHAAAFTLLVPAATGLLYAPVWLGAIDAPGQVLWLIYETGFSYMKMGEAALLPKVRAAEPGTLLVADGTSCRHQIRDGAGRDALHVARVLEKALV